MSEERLPVVPVIRDYGPDVPISEMTKAVSATTLPAYAVEAMAITDGRCTATMKAVRYYLRGKGNSKE